LLVKGSVISTLAFDYHQSFKLTWW